MYTAIRQAKVKAGLAEELARRTNEGAVPIIRSMPGFEAYYMVYADDDTVTTVSVFEDQAAAEECNRRIMDWIRQNLGPLLVSPPVATAGRVIVHTAG